MALGRLQFILAEAGLERIPEELLRHPAVTAQARRRSKKPEQLILDRSYHHDAMKRLSEQHKRGRPDIVHMVLLTMLGSPLDREGLLDVYVHTWQDYVIKVNPAVRLPRNYDRFVGLIEQLYEQKYVPHEGERLMELRIQSLHVLLEELQPARTIAFSTLGESRSLRGLFDEKRRDDATAVLVGGFPKGHLKREHEKLANELVSIDKDALDAWIVAGRIIYEFECATGLDERRLG